MSLRARTRNSSGGVAESRKPARLSATSGWLLTFSGTVVLDQQLQGIHRDAKHAVHVLRVQMMDLARAQLVDAQVDRARTQLADASDDEQRRRLHIVAKHAGARPHRQLIAQLMPPRHAVGNEVRVERVNRPDDPDVVGRARRLRGVDERVHDVERRNCRVLEGDVAVGRALGANRSDADDEVAHLDLGLRRAARAHTEEGVHPKLAQLLDTDRHGWPSHTGRDGRDRDAEQAAGERAVLAAERDLAGAVQVLGDQRRPARIAWNQYVLSDLAFREPYVVFLLACRRHRKGSLDGSRPSAILRFAVSSIRAAWASFGPRVRPRHWATAFAVAAVGQSLLSFGGNTFPSDTGPYGAPFPVGQGSGSNIIFMSDTTFFLPLWLLNVIVTALVVLVLATVLEGRTAWGVAAVSAAVVLAYIVVVIIQDGEASSNQLVVWLWMLVALGLVWAARYWRTRKPSLKFPPTSGTKPQPRSERPAKA